MPPPLQFCHAPSTTAPTFVVCLLPLSVACSAFRTVLLTSCWKKEENWQYHPFASASSLAPSPTKNSVQDKHSLLWMCHAHCSVVYLCDCLQLFTPSHSHHSACDALSLQIPGTKLQALVYDILPSTTAVFSYAIGSRKLSANQQFFVGAQTVVSLLQTTQIKQGIYSHQQSLQQCK